MEHVLDAFDRAVVMELFNDLGPVSEIIHFAAFAWVPKYVWEPHDQDSGNIDR